MKVRRVAAAAVLACALGLRVRSAPVVGASAPAPSGYWLLSGDGGVFAFGAPFVGSPAADPTRCPPNVNDRSEPNGTCWSMAATPDGNGYWILNGDTGVIYPFGDAGFFGDPAQAAFPGAPRGLVPNGEAIVTEPNGKGYWVLDVGLSGLASVVPLGSSGFFGDPVVEGAPHAGQPVGLAATPDGGGYWVVDSDGGVFGYGDGRFFGSMGAQPLNGRIVGMAGTPTGRGYYLVAADGGVFAFGDARFAGSMVGHRLNQQIVGMAVDAATGGYWLASADGGVFAFGGAPFRGSMAGHHLNQPIFDIVAAPARA